MNGGVKRSCTRRFWGGITRAKMDLLMSAIPNLNVTIATMTPLAVLVTKLFGVGTRDSVKTKCRGWFLMRYETTGGRAEALTGGASNYCRERGTASFGLCKYATESVRP